LPDLATMIPEMSGTLSQQHRCTTVTQNYREKHSCCGQRQAFATIFLYKMPIQGFSEQAAANFIEIDAHAVAASSSISA
jgi:hypothetical protein